jgi:hypothetical protein
MQCSTPDPGHHGYMANPGITGDFPLTVLATLDAHIGRQLACFDNLPWLDGSVIVRTGTALRRASRLPAPVALF